MRGIQFMREVYTDRGFLLWLHERLEHVHKENYLYDYMHRFRAIISTIPEGVRSERQEEALSRVEKDLYGHQEEVLAPDLGI